MAILKTPHYPNVLTSRVPPGTPPPKYKALLLCMSYSSCLDGFDPGDRPSPLEGPLNDAREMKAALIDLFHYREQDIFVMTDEENNVGTKHWPSMENIFRAMDNLVRKAAPGDAFVFYYAGHGGKKYVVGGDHAYILTCDNEKIFDYVIRIRLVDPLPRDCRMTAILDTCHSGGLLSLEHYDCHCFMRGRSQSFSERKKPLTPRNAGKRRQSESALAALQPWVIRDKSHLCSAFKRAVTVTRVVLRLKFLVANRPKGVRNAHGPPTPRPRCGSCFCIYGLLNTPLVISVSACSPDEKTWEDRERQGQGMTTELIKILKQNPSIHVGDLYQQLTKRLSELALERLWEVRAELKTRDAELPHEQRIRLEQALSQDVLDERSQTAQIGSLYPLRWNDQFILDRNRDPVLSLFDDVQTPLEETPMVTHHK